MNRVRGMHDIATHGTLARQVRLISVARDGFGSARQRSDAGGITSKWEDWDVKKHVFQKPHSPSSSARWAEREIEFTRGMLNEFDAALKEGFAVSNEAREQLKTKLARLTRGKATQ